MHETLALGLCILPLLFVFVMLKLSVLLLASEQEVEHVIDESHKPHEYLDNAYADVDEQDPWD